MALSSYAAHRSKEETRSGTTAAKRQRDGSTLLLRTEAGVVLFFARTLHFLRPQMQSSSPVVHVVSSVAAAACLSCRRLRLIPQARSEPCCLRLRWNRSPTGPQSHTCDVCVAGRPGNGYTIVHVMAHAMNGTCNTARMLNGEAYASRMSSCLQPYMWSHIAYAVAHAVAHTVTCALGNSPAACEHVFPLLQAGATSEIGSFVLTSEYRVPPACCWRGLVFS